MSEPAGNVACHCAREGRGRLGQKRFKRDLRKWTCNATTKQPFRESQLPTQPPGDYKEEHFEGKQRRDEGDGDERTWAVHFQCKWVLVWLRPQGLGGRNQHYKVQGLQCTLYVSLLFSEGSFVFMSTQVCVPISVLNVQTHRHLPKLLGVGKNAVLHEAGSTFHKQFFLVSVNTIFISEEGISSSGSLSLFFHCFLSCLIFLYQCSYSLLQASDQAMHIGIAWGF